MQRGLDHVSVMNGTGTSIFSKQDMVIKLTFIAPIIILIAGTIVYFGVIPNICGQVISVSDWIYSTPQNIIDIIANSSITDTMKIYILILKVFWYLWFAAFVASLYFVERNFHKKPKLDAVNAILEKREPYLLVLDIIAVFNVELQKSKDGELDLLVDELKRIEEKLFVESDFGYGKEAVINCENNIAKELQYLLDSAPYISSGNMEENIAELSRAVIRVNLLLKKRMELKRR